MDVDDDVDVLSRVTLGASRFVSIGVSNCACRGNIPSASAACDVPFVTFSGGTMPQTSPSQKRSGTASSRSTTQNMEGMKTIT